MEEDRISSLVRPTYDSKHNEPSAQTPRKPSTPVVTMLSK